MKVYTIDEKIDYIFTEMKSQKRTRILVLVGKIIIILLLIYGYFTFLHGLDKKVIIDKFSQTISDIAKPITQNLVNDMLNENSNNDVETISDGLIEKLKNNPDLLNNFKK